MEAWYIDDATRWEREQKELEGRNIGYEIDKQALAYGFIRLRLEITSASKLQKLPEKFLPLSLTAVFPPRYPYFRPEVYAPGISLPRHQNIIGKNLCLIPRLTVHWKPQTTLAEHLNEQLYKVLIEGEIVDPEQLLLNEQEQAEPVSEYYLSQTDAPIIFDPEPFETMDQTDKPIAFLGTLTLGIPEHATIPTRMVVLEAFNAQKQSMGKLSPKLRDIFPPRAHGCVYRLKERPPHGNPIEDYKWIVGLLREQRVPPFVQAHKVKLKGNTAVDNVIGLMFPEEHKPGQLSWGWLFIIQCSTTKFHPSQKRSVPYSEPGAYYAKVSRINKQDMSFRIPSLRHLQDKQIAVVGLGALGAPSAIEFAKNGVGELRNADFDIVNAGTTIRWSLGIASAGILKTAAIEKSIAENYPFTNVRSFRIKIGGTEYDAQTLPPRNYQTDDSQLAELIEGASLIFDASAEIGVNHFLSELAKKQNIPYLGIYGTPGVWGGVVARIMPGSTDGCWMCLQYALEDGTIPNPPIDRSGNLQPPGCGDISFIGTSFELMNIVAAGVRMAIGAFYTSEGDYPNITSDVGILSLVDDHGNPIFPRWTQHSLMKHPSCPYCTKADHNDL